VPTTKTTKTNTGIFYRDKPVFGLDIGLNTIKVVQIGAASPLPEVLGYGVIDFDPRLLKDGAVIGPDAIAARVKELISHKVVGQLTSNRVNVTIPAVRTFTRSLVLPVAAGEDLAEAVNMEVEQYIPVPLSELYVDYSVIRRTSKDIELLAVAVTKKIVDSYLQLMGLVGLEVMSIEPTSAATSRVFEQLDKANVPTILIDFGAISSDVILYDQALVTMGTVAGGGDNFTAMIAAKLKVSVQEAHFLKTKYGLGVSVAQKGVRAALDPLLQQIVLEIRRVLRYYEEHYQAQKIGQIVTTGGGANLPGLNEFLTDELRVPARPFSPWDKLDFQKLTPPDSNNRSMFITAIGSALLHTKEIFR
jgi:type IV pilus assembly protein PilM